MSDLSILKEMITPKAIVEILEQSSMRESHKTEVKLTEPQSPGSSIIINGLPESTLIIKSDCFKPPDSLFTGKHDECKRGDYIIISIEDNRADVIFIEIKTTSENEYSIIHQLKGSECLFYYIRIIGRSFWGKQDFLIKYIPRFVSICHTTIDKRPSRSKKQTGKHNCPEQFLKISYSTRINYNHLLGKAQNSAVL